MTIATSAPVNLTFDPGYPALKDYLIAQTGLVYYANRDEELTRLLSERLRSLNLDDCGAYLRALQQPGSGGRERDLLIQSLTIGETYFFRHGELFRALERVVLPDLLERNRLSQRLRIWSAGCSIGAEVYSLAILLHRLLAGRFDDWAISILGTDINREYLTRAARGQFEDWALRGMTDSDRRAYLRQDETGWTILPRFRCGVSFQYHNLASDAFPPASHVLADFDLILCRNVLIYFAPDVISRTVRGFHSCLADGGWLLVGHAEHNADWFTQFRTLMVEGAVCYQKRDSDATPPAAPSSLNTNLTDILKSAHNESSCSSTLAPLETLPAGVTGWQAELARGAKGFPPPVVRRDEASHHDAAAAAEPADLTRIRELADRGQLAAAQADCRRLVEARQLDPTAHFYFALISEQLGEYDAALRAFARAVYLDRNDVSAHYCLGLLAQKQGQRGRAIRSFQNVARLLKAYEPRRRLPHFDDLTADHLRQLTTAHLHALQQP